jgi:hypothetical protein
MNISNAEYYAKKTAQSRGDAVALLTDLAINGIKAAGQDVTVEAIVARLESYSTMRVCDIWPGIEQKLK